MDYALLVEVAQTEYYLVEEELGVLFGQFLAATDIVEEVTAGA